MTQIARKDKKMLVASCCFVLLFTLVDRASSASPRIGVNYGRMGDNLPNPSQTAQLMIQYGITKVKLYDADPAVISAFANTGIEVAVSMYNEAIWELSAGQQQASNWFTSNILPHIQSSTNVTTILFGNEVLTRADPALALLLVPAMRNLYIALQQMGLSSTIKLTTTHAMDVLDFFKSFPPSAGTFKISWDVMKPLLDFHAETGSPFMIDAYPYFAYRDDKGEHVELAYVLLQNSSKGVTDWNTGFHYTNMLDAQIDTIYAAISKMGHNGTVRVVVGETGWPSVGEARNYGAGMENAAEFVSNLVKRTGQDWGTPLQPGIPVEAYLFALFNENQKQGSTAERNFGLFYPNMTQVYQVSFTSP